MLRPVLAIIALVSLASVAAPQDVPLPPPTVERAPSQPETAPPDGFVPERLAPLDVRFEELVAEQRIAGAVVVLCRGDGEPVVRTFGEQSRGIPMREDTIFRIYSMSKPITAVAALILVEEGKVGLDDPVATYVPAFEGLVVQGKREHDGRPERAPTVRDLLLHTAGLSYGFGGDAVDRQYREKRVLGAPDLDEMMERIAQIPLANEPGERWRYSVANDVLGRVVEVASEQTFDAFLRTRIFEPLEMLDTGFHVPEASLDRFATNHGPKRGGGLRVIDGTTTSRYARPATLLSGGGGLVSTAGDYLRFCRMLLRGGELDGKRILRAETVAEMTRNQLPVSLLPLRMGARPMRGTGFGLGVSVRFAKRPAVRQGEYGWGGAASTNFVIAPVPGLIVITMTQLMPFDGRAAEAAKSVAFDALAPPASADSD